MWNGDGKVCVDAYPVELIKKYQKKILIGNLAIKIMTIPCWLIFMILAQKKNRIYGDARNV
jgi:hypothetical protein